MNALWAGGAEAMTVQGVRITNRTVIRCIGNVILVDGTSYSPPYVIQAIGDPDTLRATVTANPRIGELSGLRDKVRPRVGHADQRLAELRARNNFVNR